MDLSNIMAVYTDVKEMELAAFLKRYDVGDLLSYKGISEGVENTNYLLHTGRGPFILTLYEKRVNRHDLPFFLGLMQHLSGKGIDCPLPVHQKDGAVIGELAGKPAVIVTFLEGAWIPFPTVAHCYAVGEVLARLHLAGLGFSMCRVNALSVADWRPLWVNIKDTTDTVKQGLIVEIEADLAFLEENWPADLPTGIIHADLFPDNVFFLGHRLSGLIDFYFACTDILAYDIAVSLNAWCFEKDFSFNLAKGRALLAGYAVVRPFSARELQMLPILAQGAALRFMLTRLYDWITVPRESFVAKKDPMEYLHRMRFHRGVSSPIKYGFEERGIVP